MEMCSETAKSLYQSATVLTDEAFCLLLAQINPAQAAFQIRNDICAVDLCNRSSFVFGEGQPKRASVSPRDCRELSCAKSVQTQSVLVDRYPKNTVCEAARAEPRRGARHSCA